MSDIYVLKAVNDNGSTVSFCDKAYRKFEDLADAIEELESCGCTVQVYKCVPVEHEVYREKVGVYIYDQNTKQ